MTDAALARFLTGWSLEQMKVGTKLFYRPSLPPRRRGRRRKFVNSLPEWNGGSISGMTMIQNRMSMVVGPLWLPQQGKRPAKGWGVSITSNVADNQR